MTHETGHLVESPPRERRVSRVIGGFIDRARQDPGGAGRAAGALDKTRSTLETAERSWATEKDVAEVEHLVYLTEKRAEIAHAIAKRRRAADEIQQLMPKRD